MKNHGNFTYILRNSLQSFVGALLLDGDVQAPPHPQVFTHLTVLSEPSFLMAVCRPLPTPRYLLTWQSCWSPPSWWWCTGPSPPLGIYSLDSPVKPLLLDGGVQAPPHPQVFTHLTVLSDPSFLMVVYRPLPTPRYLLTWQSCQTPPSWWWCTGPSPPPRYLLTWQSCRTPPSWWWCTGPSPPPRYLLTWQSCRTPPFWWWCRDAARRSSTPPCSCAPPAPRWPTPSGTSQAPPSPGRTGTAKSVTRNTVKGEIYNKHIEPMNEEIWHTLKKIRRNVKFEELNTNMSAYTNSQ